MIFPLELTPSPLPSTLFQARVWDSLYSPSQSSPETPFSTLQWQNLWWRHFGQEYRWSAFTIRENGRVIGIAPFYWDPGTGFLKLIGGEDLSDYLDILAAKGRESQVWDQILGYLESSPPEIRGLDLHCLPSTSPALQVLPPLAESRGYQVQCRAEEVCPTLELPGTWDAYLALLARKERHELRRKMRKAEQSSPPLRFRQCKEEECAREDIRSFICLHRKSQPEKQAFMDKQREAFFREASDVFAKQGWLRLYIMEREEKAVAAMLCFDYREALYLYNSGFDPELSALSPGIVLIGHCLQDAIARGKRWFDFLRGNEDYKYRLGGKDSPIFRIIVKKP